MTNSVAFSIFTKTETPDDLKNRQIIFYQGPTHDLVNRPSVSGSSPKVRNPPRQASSAHLLYQAASLGASPSPDQRRPPRTAFPCGPALHILRGDHRGSGKELPGEKQTKTPKYFHTCCRTTQEKHLLHMKYTTQNFS